MEKENQSTKPPLILQYSALKAYKPLALYEVTSILKGIGTTGFLFIYFFTASLLPASYVRSNISKLVLALIPATSLAFLYWHHKKSKCAPGFAIGFLLSMTGLCLIILVLFGMVYLTRGI